MPSAVERLGGVRHRGPVRAGPHDDADQWFHRRIVQQLEFGSHSLEVMTAWTNTRCRIAESRRRAGGRARAPARRRSGRGRRQLRGRTVRHRAHGRARVRRAAARSRPRDHRLSRRTQGQREHDGFLGGERRGHRPQGASASAASRRPTSTRASPTPSSWRSSRPISICTSRGTSTSTKRRSSRCAARTPRASLDARIANSEGASVSSGVGHRVYANSHGFVGAYPTSTHSMSCSVLAKAERLARARLLVHGEPPSRRPRDAGERRRGGGAPRGAAARRAHAVDAQGARALSGRARERACSAI